MENFGELFRIIQYNLIKKERFQVPILLTYMVKSDRVQESNDSLPYSYAMGTLT